LDDPRPRKRQYDWSNEYDRKPAKCLPDRVIPQQDAEEEKVQ
jgi:hypothetical protein